MIYFSYHHNERGRLMRIYHGSSRVLQQPEYLLGNPKNDYGRGFYCTEELDMAKEWACKRNSDGFANAYELRDDGLRTLDLMGEGYTVLNWMALLLKNRQFALKTPVAEDARDYLIEQFAPPVEQYDVVRGYRADDSYFSYAQSFVENGLPLGLLNRALKLGNLGEQVVLVSERAFAQLAFEGAEPVAAAEYYPRFLDRDIKARDAYRNAVRRARTYRDDLFIMDIMREGVGNDDPRVRRLLSA